MKNPERADGANESNHNKSHGEDHQDSTQPQWLREQLLDQEELEAYLESGRPLDHILWQDLELNDRRFVQKDFAHANFAYGVNIKGCSFQGCNLADSYLGVRIEYTVFRNTDLSRVTFARDISHTAFLNAKLVAAKAEGYAMRGGLAHLSAYQCDFSGADLRGADFRQMDFRDCTFAGAKYDQHTQWGSNPVPQDAVFVEE